MCHQLIDQQKKTCTQDDHKQHNPGTLKTIKQGMELGGFQNKYCMVINILMVIENR